METMTQEDKALLLKDLSARLPYGVKAYVKNWSNFKTYEDVYEVKSTFPSLNEVHVQSKTGSLDVLIGYYDYEFKPYLFPMSSMTEEQKEELSNEMCYLTHSQIEGRNPNGLIESTVFEIDFYNKYHIDYRGLIEKGLALDATGLNIY